MRMSAQLTEPKGEKQQADSGTDPPSGSISKDDAFHILQNARRRAVLRYLLDHPDQERFRMRDLAEEVAAWEHDTTVRQLTSDQRQRVYIALYQSHLPKLDEHHVIEYNQPRGVVEQTPLTPVFEPYLAEGLHADTALTVRRNDPEDDQSTGGLTDAVTTLLNRSETEN